MTFLFLPYETYLYVYVRYIHMLKAHFFLLEAAGEKEAVLLSDIF